ncbi:MAG: hypothetical protein PVH18_11600 [Chloroflexota bacterium]|jgi:hypothetical protein
MKNVAEQQPQPPPGIVATLAAGFELTTAHLWLILLPIFLDVIYWLGPRLGIVKLTDQLLRPLLEEPSVQEAASQIIDMASGINMLTSLSVPLIGIPALMGGETPEVTPLQAQVYELDNVMAMLVLQIGLSLAGLFLAALYLGLISLALEDEDKRPSRFVEFAVATLKNGARLLALGLVFVALLIMVWLPLLPIALLVGLVAGGLAIYVMLSGFVLVVTYLSMSVPGIVLKGRPVVRSVWESIRMVHRNALPTVTLLFLVVLISSGTNWLWRLADDGSWLTVVSIAGHAFVSTALAAAIFIFYRDRWLFAQRRLQESTVAR